MSPRGILLILLLGEVLFAAKVALFVLPLSNSHVLFTIRVAEELARDHEVVIIRPTINPAATLISKHPNVREIRTKGAPPELFKAFKASEKRMLIESVPLGEWFEMAGHYAKVVTEACEDMASDDEFIAQMRAEKFDLAITHYLDSCPVSVIHAAQIPQFGYILSVPLVKAQLNNIGLPGFPAIHPSQLLDASIEMTFKQRLNNFIIELFQSIITYYLQPIPIDTAFRAKFGEDFPSTRDLHKKGTFLISNVHPDIEYPVMATSKVSFIGGLGLSNVTKELEEPYASFIDKAEKVVFISFGTIVEPKIFPLSWKEAFVDLFKRNPSIHFIWRMDDDVKVPSNVLKSMWLPQKDILAHPKLAAFITHGGYNSIGESIASGTPLIVVPLCNDQFRNSRLVQYRQFGVRVEKDNITANALNDALHEILENPSYASNATALSNILFSSPISSGDALRHTVSFALNHPNHNRDIPDLNLLQLFSIDMILIVIVLPILAVILMLVGVWKILRFLFSCIRLVPMKEKTN